jgi:hypothetical protein
MEKHSMAPTRFNTKTIACLIKFSFLICLVTLITQTVAAQSPVTASNSVQASVLNAEETAKIMPASVFFRGQSASVQGRNSGGIRFGDKSLMLVSLIDTSGYSSQVQEKYQAYLITESAVDIDGHRLAPGAYGCGFLSGDNFIVMDLGGHDLFTAHSTHDVDLRRPSPLQVVVSPTVPGDYRLYAGRNYISFRVAR